MKKAVYRHLAIFLGFLSLFFLGRLLFLLLNSEGQPITPSEGFDIIRAALPMDLSACAILMSIYLLLSGLISLFFHHTAAFRAISQTVYWFLGLALGLISTLDIRMFGYWGFRIDREFFSYLVTPTEAMASVSAADVGIVSGILVVFLIVQYLLTRVIFKSRAEYKKAHSWKFLLFGFPFLFVLARGGIGPTTMNQGTVYHSAKPFNNYAAINPFWNFIYSFSINSLDKNRYHFLDDGAFDELLNKLQAPPNHHASRDYIDHAACNNLILIVLESFTAQATGSISGNPIGCTPNFDRAAKEGVLFTRHYSTGDRSAESLVTLFTGFPAFTRVDVLDNPARLRKLPHLYRELDRAGYETLFEYGGDLDFANMTALFREGHTSSIVDIHSLQGAYSKNRWGIHDEHVFSDFYNRISEIREPFAAGVFSLSSHEPYTVPRGRRFEGENGKLFDALYYTDSCLGILLDQIKRSSFFANTLVVVTADHGIRQPGNWSVLDANKFHTPLLLLGGPVKQPAIIDHPVSQAAIAPFLADAFSLKWPTSTFQSALFDSSNRVFYAYNDGAGLVEGRARHVYDVAMGTCYEGSDEGCRILQAYLQLMALKMDELSAP